MKLYSYDPKKKTKILVGDIDGDTLTREVNVRHFMRILDGYGIQESAFQDALEQGVKTIVQHVQGVSDIWTASTKDWIEHGKVMDYGHGKQRFLSLKYMTRGRDL